MRRVAVPSKYGDMPTNGLINPGLTTIRRFRWGRALALDNSESRFVIVQNWLSVPPQLTFYQCDTAGEHETEIRRVEDFRTPDDGTAGSPARLPVGPRSPDESMEEAFPREREDVEV